MQVAYQTDTISEKKSAVSTTGAEAHRLVSSKSNFKNDQTGIMPHKTQNENYSNARVYSPYLAPSSAVIIDIQNRQIDTEPIFVHNIARTKYFNVSKPAIPAEHFKINLFA